MDIEIVGVILGIIASIVTIISVINNKAKGNFSKSTDSNVAQNVNSSNNTTIQANQGAEIHIHEVTPTAPAQNINSNGNTTIQATGNSQIHIHGVTPIAPAQNNTSHIKQPCIDFLECANTIFNDKRFYASYDVFIETQISGLKIQHALLDKKEIDQGVVLFLGARDCFITEIIKKGLQESDADDVIINTIDLFPNLFKKLYIDIEPNEKLVFSIHSKNLFTQIDRNAISIHGDQIKSCIDRLKSGSCDQYL